MQADSTNREANRQIRSLKQKETEEQEVENILSYLLVIKMFQATDQQPNRIYGYIQEPRAKW